MKTVLDNLIHRLEIAEMMVALRCIRASGCVEYADHPGHARFLAEELMPRLERDCPLDRRAARRAA